MGESGSLSRMLVRSLGAGSFVEFWQYWNPIGGFYLSTYVFKPLKKRIRPASAFLLTFAVSGAIHDIAAMLINRKYHLLFTVWFSVLGAQALHAKTMAFRYQKLNVVPRIVINLSYLTINYIVARFVYDFIGNS